jgi:phosphomannomutase/phosphoglucomutase
VRASNTGAVLVLRFEADSNDRLAEIKALVEGRLAQIMADVGAPPPKIAAH